MRRLWATVVAVPLFLAITLGTIPATAQSPPPLLAAPALVRYEDPVGDTEDEIGPDILAVTVSQPDPSSVTISVEFALAPPVGYDLVEGYTDMLMVIIATGPEGLVRVPDGISGGDFTTGVHGVQLQDAVAHGAPLLTPDGAILPHAVAVAVDGATLALTLTRESLGDPDHILFFVGVGREGETETSGGDDCPDIHGEGPMTHAAWTFPSE